MKTYCLLFISCLCSTVAGYAGNASTTNPTKSDLNQEDRHYIEKPDSLLGGQASPFYNSTNLEANEYRSSYIQLYFPAIPPALAETASPSGHRRPSSPNVADAAGFSGEIFYLPYKGLTLNGYVFQKRAQRIEAYRSARDQLLATLRSRLQELKDVTGAPRAAALAEFASVQAGPLRDLALEEEGIRSDLTTRGFFRQSVDETNTTIYRADGAGEQPRKLDAGPQAAIKASQLQAGLSTPQRLLLHEISIEEQLSGEKNASPSPYVFFWPATARIRIPSDLSPVLAAKIAEFQAGKDSLKDELRAAITRGPEPTLVGQRAEAYARLAEQQAGRFTRLDDLAEEIRLGLVELPYPDEPARSDLPAGLTHRAGDAIARKAVLLRELNNQLKVFRRDLPADKIEIVSRGGGLAIAVTPIKSSTQRDRPGRDGVIARLRILNEDFSRRFAALGLDIDALREEIQKARDADGRGVSLDVDQVAAEFEKSYAARRNWDRFREYYAAVIQPGLSPAQRRLLFNGAVVALEAEMNSFSN
jgi:hypothetical protein